MSKIDSWVTKVPRLKNSKVARFSYKAEAYANDDIEGVSSYDYARDMNVPLATHTDFDASVLTIGARSNFSSVPKNGLNHFFGRVSYNLNKVIDFLSDFLDDFRVQGVETLRRSANFTLGTYADGKKIRIANTHATNTITCTPPSGQTMNGNGTISIPAGRIIDIELIGTTWKDNLTGNLVGNAGTATKLATARTINGVSFDGSTDITVADSTKAPVAHASSVTTYGASSETNYGHAKASTVVGSANGVASKGSTPTVFAQSNHVHPYEIETLRRTANFTLSINDGEGKKIYNTGSANIIVTLPSGVTQNGVSTFTVFVDEFLEIARLGAIVKVKREDWQLLTTITASGDLTTPVSLAGYKWIRITLSVQNGIIVSNTVAEIAKVLSSYIMTNYYFIAASVAYKGGASVVLNATPAINRCNLYEFTQYAFKEVQVYVK